MSDPNALLRIIEQPNTPVELFAVRFVSMASLFSTRNAKISCSIARRSRRTRLEAGATADAAPSGADATMVATKRIISSAECCGPRSNKFPKRSAKRACPPELLQLAPICSFNAFEFAYPEIFANEAFLLLDMGHLQSTVLIGSKRELVLVRSIDYGGKAFSEALTADGALDAKAARLMVEQGDAGMAEICRDSLDAPRDGSAQLDRIF